MAQYYQLQNLDELKQIYADVQVVHVSSDDVGPLLLHDDQILLNDGQVVYQTTTVNQSQYQQQQPQSTTHYIIGDDIGQQQQHQQQQVILEQQMDHQSQVSQQQHYQQDNVQQTQQQIQQQSQTQQVYYSSPDQIIQHSGLQQQQQQQQQQTPPSQPQQQHEITHPQYQQQQIVHSQHAIQTPQHQVQVYRMSTQQHQQNPTIQQQSQMLGNTHVIVQQPSGQPLLLQSPQHHEIIMRQPIQPQHRIIYNTNRVLYSPQQQQTQTILQPSTPHQQHIQLQTTPTMNADGTRLVQTRVTPQTSLAQQQTAHQQLQQSVVFHQIGTVQNPQAQKPLQQIQQPQQPTPPQQQHQQVQVQQPQANLMTSTGNIRGGLRGKMPARGGSTLVTRMPGMATTRATIRPTLTTQVAGQNVRSPRPRGNLTATTGSTRGRGGARGGRGAATNIAGRGAQLVSTSVGSVMEMGQQHQLTQQGKNLNVSNINQQQGQMKTIYRPAQLGDSANAAINHSPQLHIVHQHQRSQNIPTQTTVRFRSPSLGGTPLNSQIQASTSTSGNFALDLEDSIQAVVVKKEQQKPVGTAAPISVPMAGTTLTCYAKEEDETRYARPAGSNSMSLAEYKKRIPSNTISTVGVGQRLSLMRATGSTASGLPPTKQSLHSAGHTIGQLPIARVAPLKQQAQPQQLNAQQQLPQHQLQQAGEAPQQTVASSVLQTSHNNYEIQTHHVLQNRNGQQMPEKDRNSAKMLVILVSGEQRLITFTLPRESCTVQDLLEQVGVPFDSNTTIQCVENPGANIDFVVTVGFSVQESASELISRAEQSLQMSRQQENSMATNAAVSGNMSNTNSTATTAGASSYGPPVNTTTANTTTEESSKESNTGSNTTVNKTPEDVPRKIIQGFYAICQSCGFSGYDHAKCERCKRVFLDPPKRVPCVKPPPGGETIPMPRTVEIVEKKRSSDLLARAKAGLPCTPGSTRGRGTGTPTRGRLTRGGRRAADAEPVILTLSSDEEAESETSIKGSLNNTKVNASTSTSESAITYKPFAFELSLIVNEKDEALIYADFQREDVTDLSDSEDKMKTSLRCKLVRFGNYRFEPSEPITFTSKGVCIVAPLVANKNETLPIHIHKCEIIKVIAHFSKTSDSILCLYALRKCAEYISKSLAADTDEIFHYPNGPCHVRKIVLQFESVSDQSRNVIKSIWEFLDEISATDAHDILHRAAESDKQMNQKSEERAESKPTQLNANEICQLLIYPPGKGGISINTEDYLCLATDQYLNDIIIDFYLKWLHNNIIPDNQREDTFIFSTFFYKRLTTLTRHQHQDKDVKQTAAQKRHARVQNWTKNVNLFEKDYIIIPINEQSHWFLAIICFPSMKGPVTFDTNLPVEPQQIKKQKGKKVSVQIGSTTITPLCKRESTSNMLAEVCAVADEDSERDEAEGDESDLASEDSDFESSSANVSAGAQSTNASPSVNTSSTTPPTSNVNANANSSINNSQPQPIKQPLILIFDSLAGASRSRVVATLRDYLTCEYKVKLPDAALHIFNKENMPGHCVKVPQQNNFTDCGLYLLQYVEQFFKDPIRDYRLPIKQLYNWFDLMTVTRKREDISKLLQNLMNEKNGPNQKIILPNIGLPTKDGVLIETVSEKFDFDEDEMDGTEEAVEEGDESSAAADEPEIEQMSDEMNGKSVNEIPTATTVVPTQGRKIVVKRRLVTNTTAERSPSLQQNVRTGNTLKIRKLEQ